MKITAKSGAALAIAAAAAIAGVAAPVTAGTNYVVKCYGLNACKGNGSCKSLANSCKGNNACKGQGIKMISKSACLAKGGKTSRG
jgi:hypothetical protein